MGGLILSFSLGLIITGPATASPYTQINSGTPPPQTAYAGEAQGPTKAQSLPTAKCPHLVPGLGTRVPGGTSPPLLLEKTFLLAPGDTRSKPRGGDVAPQRLVPSRMPEPHPRGTRCHPGQAQSPHPPPGAMCSPHVCGVLSALLPLPRGESPSSCGGLGVPAPNSPPSPMQGVPLCTGEVGVV